MWKHEPQSRMPFFGRCPCRGGDVSFRRPPAGRLARLSARCKRTGSKDAELYSLRALEDEQQLDFTAAEADWKSYASNSADPIAAQLSLADFYHRRLRPSDEISALSVVARAPMDPSEKLLSPMQQRSWKAFQRIFEVIAAQGLSADISSAQYLDWLARYPEEASVYGNFLQFLIAQKDYAAANQLIARYHTQFPNDEIFPIKAQALLEYRQGSLQQGLAVYEKNFQPLWAPDLVRGYFDLLEQTHGLRKFLDDARAAESTNPGDLSATARIFYYYQYENKVDAAQEAIESFRSYKDSTSVWTGAELLVCARLLEGVHAYPDAARYYFALYNSQGTNGTQQQALEGLSNLLFTAPEEPIRFGSGDLSMYRDVATLDAGPGYLNGILSLILNTTDPADEFRQEEQRGAPYFRRSQAAQLLSLLDTNFPASARRPELHTKLLNFYATSGESAALIKGGTEFLAAFPNAPQRTEVALPMADAYARTGNTRQEFAIYDSVLQELAAQADRVPLGMQATGAQAFAEGSEDQKFETNGGSLASQPVNSAFALNGTPVLERGGARSPEYARVLERYLARLAQLKQIPDALAVLRREIDRNPDDPGLYEQLAAFLQQNRLGAEEEEIYRRAIARFPDRSWYQKLARFYLRYRRNDDFEKLTQEAVSAFKGSDLEQYFRSVQGAGGPAMYLRVNQYANARFPHNPVFVRNLLNAYRNPLTADPAAWEALLRQHWFEETDLRNEFFEYLTRTGKLDAEMRVLQPEAPGTANTSWDDFAQQNPAAAEYLAQANLWRSHFEESAPALVALAAEYPADAELGETASAVHRSLAYFDPTKTDVAVRLENDLLAANPGHTEYLERIGDIYADRALFAQAAPYWERIPQATPGEPTGYLEAATIYWDYFDYDNALRLLDEGRQKLANDSLYRYESGAIYEGKRDYQRAIQEYVQGALAPGTQSLAGQRLLALARRPQLRTTVTKELAAPARSANASLAAVSLYARVLAAQNRKQDLEAFLTSAVDAAATLEQAGDLENLAEQQSLDAVRARALEKEASLAFDPVARLQFRYTLVRLYEGRKDFAAARKNVEALYRENPKILGVVRSTVDFYWRMKLYPQAIAVLLQAANDAQPDLAKQFRYEAARKSTEQHLYTQARGLLTDLLKDSPYDSNYLAAMSETYAQAGDQQGLKQFYLDHIAQFRSAPLSDDERKTRIAELRRGLIPALERLQDRAGAVDQYIELINNFPEDEGLTSEAAQYAARHNRQSLLVDFYVKTVAQSPRDYRWPMVLARIQTSLEDFPAAIDAYAKASAVRPDRSDLRIAAAVLEERLMRLDDAAAEYERVYQLAYKDPQWMEKVAEIRARQGKADDAVVALKTALIDGRPEKPENYFEVARRLESWGMLTQSREFAEQCVHSAGNDLLAVPDNHAGAALFYARIMTRLRQQEMAYNTLSAALSAASSTLPVMEEQVAKEGIAAATDSALRTRLQAERVTDARQGMRASLIELGNTAALYFTPEEKTSFAQFAQKLRQPMSLQDVDTFVVPLAQSANLAELEATWRYELMTEPGLQPNVLIGRMQAYADLQRRRMSFAELGRQLEQFASGRIGIQGASILQAAADAYDAVGDENSELRVLSVIPIAMSYEHQVRFLELLLMKQPQRLVQVTAQWTPFGEQAADFAITHGDAALAKSVIAARGQARPPVWSKAYSSLTGLYFSDAGADVNKNFLDALGDDIIGNRLKAPLNRNDQLAGDIWFYYGSRYGEYLGATKQGTPDDFLPSVLEQSPGSASAYLELADYYLEAGNTRAAIADYEHALELQPGRADLRERLAIAYYKRGARAEAIAQWKLVFSTLSRALNSGRPPENFWTDFARSCADLQTRKLFAELKPNVDELLRTFLRKNGNYRSSVLLQNAYLGLGAGPATTEWLLNLASAAANPTAVLADVAEASWIPLGQRAAIYREILDAKQAAVTKTQGLEHDSAQQDLVSWQIRWIGYLIETERFGEAANFTASLPEETLRAKAEQIIPYELHAAAQLGTLDRKLADFRSAPENAPASDVLRASARDLAKAGDNRSARKVLEFVFQREIDGYHLDATNFLGLAEARIIGGDTPGAVELLRRLVLVVGAPYENLNSAAELLEKTGHNAEATEFLNQLVKSAPWEPSNALRLAKAELAASRDVGTSRATMTKLASSLDSPYALRVDAAVALSGTIGTSTLGSAELSLLTGSASSISATAADQPFFSDARIKAAANLHGPAFEAPIARQCTFRSARSQ